MSENPVHEMHELECWERLRSREFGRLAYHLLDEVHIVPINYTVASGRRLLFRTTAGSKLLGVVMHADVAFEIDGFELGGPAVDGLESERAWSVIARGRAERVEGRQAREADALPLRPWVDTPKDEVVAIVVTEVTGRTFDLYRPWRHVRVDHRS
jgi:nitroimidazol reductase NimA-like FMN-containing flavoprotein (pyridoxamine 5'-phosphate oxidase superfamily)